MRGNDIDAAEDDNLADPEDASAAGGRTGRKLSVPLKFVSFSQLRGIWEKVPGSSDKYVVISVAGYLFALFAAWWLVYMGACTGASCFVLKIYPPGASTDTFSEAVVQLRDSLPWLVPTALLVFITIWGFLGWVLWIKSPSAWNGKSGILALVSVVVLFGFAIWLTSTTLNEIRDVDGSIAYWISLPSLICATVAFVYLGLWFVRERDSARVAHQVSDSIQRLDQLAGRAEVIERSGLLPQDKLGELKRLEDEIDVSVREMQQRSDERADLRSGTSPSSAPKDLMLHSIAASKNLTKYVNGSFWEFARTPDFRAEAEWGLKAIASELSAKLDRLNASIGAELKLIWDDLEKLEQDAGAKVIDSGEWVNPDDVGVIAKFEDSGWNTRGRTRRPNRNWSGTKGT
jgi:hypothetical protein